jgi:hypothetical protein
MNTVIPTVKPLTVREDYADVKVLLEDRIIPIHIVLTTTVGILKNTHTLPASKTRNGLKLEYLMLCFIGFLKTLL